MKPFNLDLTGAYVVSTSDPSVEPVLGSDIGMSSVLSVSEPSKLSATCSGPEVSVLSVASDDTALASSDLVPYAWLERCSRK